MTVDVWLRLLRALPAKAEVYFLDPDNGDRELLRVDGAGIREDRKVVILFSAPEMPTKSGAPGRMRREP